MNDPIAGYGQAISRLRSASGGRYGGPSVSEAALRTAYESVDGLNTGELRSGALMAAGSTQTADLQQWILPVIKFIGSMGAGMIASELVDKAQEWFSTRDEADEVSDAADRAADAIDVTVGESDEGTAAILAQLMEIIGQISAHLSTIDPAEHPDAFAAVVQAGASIISDAAMMILGLCADRDKAIEECYCALIEHGKRVCGKPEPELAGAVMDGCEASKGAAGSAAAGGAAAGTGGVGTTSTAPAVNSSAAAGGASASSAVTAPASATAEGPPTAKEKESEPAEKPAEKPVVKPAAKVECEPEEKICETDPAPEPAKDCEPEPVKDCVEPEPSGEPCEEPEDEPVEQIPEEPDNRIRNTLVGALGVGILAVGVGAVVHFLEQAFHEVMTGMEPDVEPAPPPEEPAAPHHPEPAGQPVNDKTPESDLHLVPEPPAKPIPTGVQANYVSDQETAVPAEATPPASATPAPTASPPSGPATVTPTPHPIPVTEPAPAPQQPEPGGTSQPRVRKAGGW